MNLVHFMQFVKSNLSNILIPKNQFDFIVESPVCWLLLNKQYDLIICFKQCSYVLKVVQNQIWEIETVNLSERCKH